MNEILITDWLIKAVSWLFELIAFLIVARAFASWFLPFNRGNPVIEFFYRTTEPILAPIREFLRSYLNYTSPIDFSPLIGIILVLTIRACVIRLITFLLLAP
ncbi:MAG: YggT family protein [Candidatus Bipolaricaulota bacterium]